MHLENNIYLQTLICLHLIPHFNFIDKHDIYDNHKKQQKKYQLSIHKPNDT